MSPAPTAGEVRAFERLGLGPGMVVVLLGMLGALVVADRRDRTADRDAFLASLARNTAAVEKMAERVGAVETGATARALAVLGGSRDAPRDRP